MSVTAVDTPLPEHHCRPGWRDRFHVHDPERRNPVGLPSPPTGWYLVAERHEVGTVVECACGRTWVTLPHLYSGTYDDPRIVQGGWNAYRPEGRWEKWRRRAAS